MNYYKTVVSNSRKLRYITGTFCLALYVLFVSACASKVDVFTLPVTDTEKQEKADFVFPSVYISGAKQVLFVMIKPEETESEKLKLFADSATFYKNNVEGKSNLRLNSAKNSPIGYPNIAELIAKNRDTEIDFIAVFKAVLLKYEVSGEKIYFEMGMTVDYYQVSTSRLIATNKVIYDPEKGKNSATEIKKFVTDYFPSRGFVTETRGNHQAAKLNTGSLAGLEKGDAILFRNTNLIQQGYTEDNVLYSTETLEYSDEIIGYGKVILLNDETCWVLIEKKYREKIKPGVVGFLYSK